MSLITSSPLIGSWADQVPDERQLKLMEQQQAASVAREIARRQAAGESMESIREEQRYQQQQYDQQVKQMQQQHQQQHQHQHQQHQSPPPPSGSSDSYHQFFIDPLKPMRSSFQPPQAPSSHGGPAGGWGLAGKLKEMARDVFERAYGLNGRHQEDHETLCEEIMISTGCSRKSVSRKRAARHVSGGGLVHS